jgi:hypothetical protein
MIPANSDKNPRYSVVWALLVVRKCLRNYPRATVILEANYWGFTQQLPVYLASGSNLWAISRDIIKRVEYSCDIKGYTAIFKALKEYTIQMYGINSVDIARLDEIRQFYVLTDLRNWANLNSQGFHRGTGGKKKRHPSSPVFRDVKPKEHYIR